MHLPAALCAIPLLVGTAAGVFVSGEVDSLCALYTAAGASLAGAAAAGAIAHRSAPEAAWCLGAAAVLAGASLGLSAARDTYRDPPFSIHGPATIEGRLREDAVLTPAGVSLTIEVGKAAPSGAEPVDTRRRVGVRVAVGGVAAAQHVSAWRAGRVVRVAATLRPPATYRNFGIPDEARTLARRGIALVGSTKSAVLVEVVRKGGPVDEAAALARAWARDRLARFVRPAPAVEEPRSAAVAAAILIGDRSGISDEDERRLQEAGTYHVVAISGGNIAILTALLLVLLRVLRVPSHIAPALTIIVLLFYGQLTGAPPSVSRAITAAAIYLAARVIDHRGPALNALAVAAIAALAISPVTALDPGFILSFGATLGILVGVPRLLPAAKRFKGSRARRILRAAAIGAAALFAATVCAEAALAPVGAALFARVTFAGLLLNFAAIPLMAVIQVCAMATLATADLAPRLADGAGHIVHLATVGLVESARLVDIAPWLSVAVIPPAGWVIVGYYAAFGALLYVRRWRNVAAAAIAAATLVMLTAPALAQRSADLAPNGQLRVVFLDVGQGDATFIQMPDGRSLLIDAGGLPGSTFDIGERVVARAVRAFGLRRLDTLAITHGDPDHMGGAASIVRLFRPRIVWEGVPVPPHEGLRVLALESAVRRATWRTVQAGDIERMGGVDLRVWHPPPPDWERQRVRNDDSIVVELRTGEVSILLTGDIERATEHALAPRLELAPLVVLKAPHHGSATSSTEAFIKAVSPKAVIFSSGRRNPFGHPHPAVVQRYRAAGVEMFRTDRHGAVMVETDGRRLDIATHSGRRVFVSR